MTNRKWKTERHSANYGNEKARANEDLSVVFSGGGDSEKKQTEV